MPGLLTSAVFICLVIAALMPRAALAQAAEEEAAGPTVLVSRHKTVPPLPFPGPQVGPLIERGFEDDVDRRTTAFIPRDLSMLTPIDMPEDVDRWIRVDLSEQLVIAYEGDQPVRGFVVSTGLPGTPTVTGTFNIRMKVRSTMTGGNPALGTYYNLPNVEWVQYFYRDYSFHGTYWHNNFGQPMSHGCLNMTNADAKWLFEWASPTWDGSTVWYPATSSDPGTLVIVHE
jgi:lipoprotein-anchoring transpeptidase ErfK/SrfK